MRITRFDIPDTVGGPTQTDPLCYGLHRGKRLRTGGRRARRERAPWTPALGARRRSVTRFDITEGFGAPSADKSPGCAQHRSVARPSAARSASGDNDPATGGNEIHACKYQLRRSYVPNSMTPRPLPPPALGDGTRRMRAPGRGAQRPQTPGAPEKSCGCVPGCSALAPAGSDIPEGFGSTALRCEQRMPVRCPCKAPSRRAPRK
jgi:hypothetical protein